MEIMTPLSCNPKYMDKPVYINDQVLCKKEYTNTFLLLVDSLICFNIYFGIIQIIYPYINNPLVEPSVWFSGFMTIILWFFWYILGQYIKNNRKI